MSGMDPDFPDGMFFYAWEELPAITARYESSATLREVRSVACPKCNARRGHHCVTATGWTSRPHRQRMTAAETAKSDGTLRVIPRRT